MPKEIIHPTWSKDGKIELSKRLEVYDKTEKYYINCSIFSYAYKYFSFKKTFAKLGLESDDFFCLI
jgi:hypothetical protein